MHRLLRLLKHRWHDERDAHRALGPGALERLTEKVKASEARHSGEIRICVEGGLPLSYLRRHATARERAITLFGKLRVWDTEHNNGVLIYLLLAERCIEIVADRGLSRHVSQAQWDEVVQRASAALQTSRSIEAGLATALDAVTELLVAHFPLTPGKARSNELPDAPVIT